MIVELAKAVCGIAAILAVWLAVQHAWRRVIGGVAPDEDVLAGRLGCRGHGCGCERPCERKQNFAEN